MYDRDLELTRQGRGILPLQTGLLKLCYHLFVATEYGVNDMWSNCLNLPRDGEVGTVYGVYRDSVECVRFTGS